MVFLKDFLNKFKKKKKSIDYKKACKITQHAKLTTWNISYMYNPRADSADDKLMIFFLFFPENRIKHFMQMFPNLHEMSKSGKNKQNTSNCHLLKLLPAILSNKMAMLSQTEPQDQISERTQHSEMT